MSGMGSSMSPGGPGSMGPGMGANPPRSFKLYAEGGHVILKQSDGGDVLWGYSETLGKWTRLAIPPGKDLLAPLIGDTVGVFWGEDRVYAYSSATGRWGELATTASPVVSFRKVTVRDHDKVSVFSDVTGRWSSTSDAVEGDETPELPRVSDMNNLPVTVQPNPLVDAAGRGVVFGDFDNDGRLDLFVTGTSEKLKSADLLESLQAQYREAERQTVQAAAEYRQTRQRLGDKDPKTRELRAGLARLVQESFDRRQQTHRLEAEILRRRLQRVDERLSDRERLKTQIIQHRLEELQNTNVRWDDEAGDQAKTRNQPALRQSARSARTDTISEFAEWPLLNLETIGVISDVAADGSIEISPRDISGIRVGDELIACHLPERIGFARLFVVKAGPESAVARMVESIRQVQNDKYVWAPVGKGIGVARPKETAEKDEDISALEHFQGQWRCVGQNDNGRETPPNELRQSQRTLFITGNRFRLADLNDGKVFKGRRLAIDSEPGQVDFLVDERSPQDDDRRMGIWHMDGQTLRICCGKEYPTEFKSGPAVLLMTFERVIAPRHNDDVSGPPPNSPSGPPADAGTNLSSPDFMQRITVRELAADSIPLEFAVLDPRDQREKPYAKVMQQRAVCLRGVVPLKAWQDQVARLADLSRVNGQRLAGDALDIRDFKVERQEASQTLPTWQEIPWDVYPVSQSVDVLKTCEGFHPDTIPESEQSAALTSPLPLLRRGAWDERVLHPRLAQARSPGSDQFSPCVLFRFFDFRAVGGRSYRYRVKLAIEGPAQGELREGPWSEPSTVAVVEKSP